MDIEDAVSTYILLCFRPGFVEEWGGSNLILVYHQQNRHIADIIIMYETVLKDRSINPS